MSVEFKSHNITTYSNTELEVLLRQALSVQEQISQEILRRLCKNSNEVSIPEKLQLSQKVVIANGRRLSEQKQPNINEDDFDIILDLTANNLRYRKNPHTHSPLIEAKLTGIGNTRLKYLEHMLEHPSLRISIENASMFHDSPDHIVETNTLAKTINLLRKALGQKGSQDTYIVTKEVWGKNYRSAYGLNENRKYLVIKDK